MIVFFVTIAVVPLMLVIGGFGIDIAAYSAQDARLQVCADAAATAAASSTYWVEPEPPETEGHWELDITQVSRFQHLNCAGAALEAPTVVGQPPEVGVVLRTTYDPSLLRLIGLDHLNLAAGAKAVRSNTKESERPDPGRSRLTQ